MVNSAVLAPGARIVIRDSEWLIRKTLKASAGSRVVIEVVGVSNFIRHETAQFIAELEEDLVVLDPKEIKLVADNSSGYLKSLLFIEGNLKQTAPTDSNLYIGHKAAMDILPFQLAPSLKALKMPRQRLLIADAVGLGKTLEAGILVSELIRRGKGRRILVVTTKSMLTQFQKEFWSRFTIPLVRLDSVGIQRIRSRIPTNHNPFNYYDKAIVSVDTLKQNREYRTYIENAYWDVIVIDEAHNVARRGKGQSTSLRAKLAERLATRSDSLIMLSATPHDGRAESFASLMNMLDPTAIASEQDYSKSEIRDLYVRRFKKDVKDQLAKNFPERSAIAIAADASSLEESAFEILDSLKLLSINKKGKAGMLFKTTLLKAMLSSPMACLETVVKRIKKVEKNGDSLTQDKDIAELEEFKSVLEEITAAEFSKYQQLLSVIKGKSKDEFAWKGKYSKDRIVIFTERLETMRFLAKNLAEDLSLSKEAIATLDGSMSDVDLMGIIEDFGNEKSSLRLLIATDVASEGINLHYLSHRLIHFDIPWSLMALQQRNGRIDRYGQEEQPQIRYLLTRSNNSRMDEVERIIQVLLVKDEQAVKNIGDPSVFMGVFDVDEEIRIVSKAIESGTSADDFASSLEPKQLADDDFDFFALLDEPVVEKQEEDGTETREESEIGEMPSLFKDDFSYVVAALEQFKQEQDLQLSVLEDELLIELTMPKELRDRYKRFPREILPEKNEPLRLSADKKAIATDLEEARRAEDSWSSLQYLWELHPIVTWLNDRGVTLFGRHQAPVITLRDNLAPQEVVFIISGVIPNRRGQPLINKWLGVVFEKNKFVRVEEFTATRDRSLLGKEPIPNTNQEVDESLLELRSQAVEEATKNILAADKEYNDCINPKLQEQYDRLEKWRGKSCEQLELPTVNTYNIAKSKKEKEQNRIQRTFEDYWNFVQESTTTEKSPYIKIVAVLRGSG
ncbi:MAG: DEAD/DEAH box helicase [Pleurocapsa minor HA4230-MV1]|jgi:SNF2 family DNA or RNA helicase|nr:DEAD/DEAH box helicase [Pleurocapsa minor HA4230-MV1]